jgi:hypothetical protein
MTRLITAVYDGTSLRLDEPLPLEPDTRVLISIHWNGVDERGDKASPDVSFFDVALSMDLGGPPDWSERIDPYQYGVDDRT